jgi:hypothetical protein
LQRRSKMHSWNWLRGFCQFDVALHYAKLLALNLNH